MKTHENRTVRFAQSGLMQAFYGGVLGAFFAILLRAVGLLGGDLWIVGLLGATIGGSIFYFGTRLVFDASEKVTKRVLMPDAEGTYAPQYSHIQALEVQEKFEAAFDAWMEVSATLPNNPSPLLRGADIQLRNLRNPARALELFERARRLPNVGDVAIRYASQKIIDIHLGPGGDEGRALVELRRFITMFPDGREADGARAAIARLKQRADES